MRALERAPLNILEQWVQVPRYCIHKLKIKHIGSTLKSKYIPYNYMDPLGGAALDSDVLKGGDVRGALRRDS